MTIYQVNRKSKLSNYKLANLTTEKGKWRNLPYDHILPIDQKEKIIINEIRSAFWSYYRSSKFKLHTCFHHLNSSQGLCFNLFFPLFHYDKKYLEYVLHKLIGIENGDIIDCEFEKILDSKEFSNFDFFAMHSNNKRTLFEIKYTEEKFDTTPGGKGHLDKYEKIYKPKLEQILKPEFLNSNFMFSNYQIVRNLSYIDENTTVVFLYPKLNLSLQNTEYLISKIVLPKWKNKVKIVYLENLTSKILDSRYLKKLFPIFESFKYIYLD